MATTSGSTAKLVVTIVVALLIGAGIGYAGGAAFTTAPPQVTTATRTETRATTVTATVTATVAPKPPRTIVIGATLPLTGPFQPIAGSFDKLYKAWEAAVNERGGLYVAQFGTRIPVKVIIYDDGSDGATAARLYERLITEDKVDFLIGPYATPVNIPVAPVATKHQVPLITTQAASPPLYNTGSEWIVTPIDLIVNWADAYFDFIAAEGKAKTIAFVIEDNAYAKGILSGAKPKAGKVGLKVVAEEPFTVGTTDFTPTIVKLKQVDADIVFVSALAPGAATFVKQAAEQGLKPREFHVPQLVKAFVETVGPQVANYITGEWFWMEGLTYEGFFGRDFWTQAMAKAGLRNEDFPWAAVTWYALEVLAAGIEKAGTVDRAQVIKAIKSLHIMTISGPTLFRDFGPFKGIGLIKPFPVQFVNGKFVVLYPPEIATGKHVYPRP